ncbi:hypothetical protein L6452_41703 [Arctium lappa]|uniref:Uncharacterized protein n=1 Tax=Arctium lappa TaxID=4217 RepID=A0ACB8XQJ4_ARCLA|nr:hypothetical protein L6452_41703 [Arctium lappa]
MATEIDIPVSVSSKKGEREDDAFASEFSEGNKVKQLESGPNQPLETSSHVAETVNTQLESDTRTNEGGTFFHALSVPVVTADEHINTPDSCETATTEDQEDRRMTKIETFMEEKPNDDERAAVIAPKDTEDHNVADTISAQTEGSIDHVLGLSKGSDKDIEEVTEFSNKDQNMGGSSNAKTEAGKEEDLQGKNYNNEGKEPEIVKTKENVEEDNEEIRPSVETEKKTEYEGLRDGITADVCVSTQTKPEERTTEDETKDDDGQMKKFGRPLVKEASEEAGSEKAESEGLEVSDSVAPSKKETASKDEAQEKEHALNMLENYQGNGDNATSSQDATSEDIKETTTSQHAITMAYFKEQDLNETPREILEKETDGKSVDAQEASEQSENGARDKSEQKPVESVDKIVRSCSEIEQEKQSDMIRPIAEIDEKMEQKGLLHAITTDTCISTQTKSQVETTEHEEKDEEEGTESDDAQKEKSSIPLVKEVCEETTLEKVESEKEVKLSDSPSMKLEEKAITILNEDDDQEKEKEVNMSEKSQGEDNVTSSQDVTFEGDLQRENHHSETGEPELVETKEIIEEDTHETGYNDETLEKTERLIQAVPTDVCISTQTEPEEKTPRNEEKDEEDFIGTDDSLMVKELCEEAVSKKVESEEVSNLSDNSSMASKENVIASKEDQDKLYVSEKGQGGDDVTSSQNASSDYIKETTTSQHATTPAYFEEQDLNVTPKDILKEEDDRTNDPQEESEQCENEAKDKREQKQEGSVNKIVHSSLETEQQDDIEEIKPSDEKLEQQGLLHVITADASNSTQTKSRVESAEHEENDEETIESDDGRTEKTENPSVEKICEETGSKKVESEGVNIFDSSSMKQNEKTVEILSKNEGQETEYEFNSSEKDQGGDDVTCSQDSTSIQAKNYEGADSEVVTTKETIEEATEEIRASVEGKEKVVQQGVLDAITTDACISIETESQVGTTEHKEKNEEDVIESDDGQKENFESPLVKEACEDTILCKDEDQESEQKLNMSEKDQGEDDVTSLHDATFEGGLQEKNHHSEGNEREVATTKGSAEEDTEEIISSIERIEETEQQRSMHAITTNDCILTQSKPKEETTTEECEEKNDEEAIECDDGQTKKSRSPMVEVCKETVPEKVNEYEEGLIHSDSSSMALNKNEIASKDEYQEKEQELHMSEKGQRGGDDVTSSQNASSEDVKEMIGQHATKVAYFEEMQGLNAMPKDILKEDAKDRTFVPQEANEQYENEAQSKREQKPEETIHSCLEIEQEECAKEIKPSVETELKEEQERLMHISTQTETQVKYQLEATKHEEKNEEEVIESDDVPKEKSNSPSIKLVCEEINAGKVEHEGVELSDNSGVKLNEKAIAILSKYEDQEKEQELNTVQDQHEDGVPSSQDATSVEDLQAKNHDGEVQEPKFVVTREIIEENNEEIKSSVERKEKVEQEESLHAVTMDANQEESKEEAIESNDGRREKSNDASVKEVCKEAGSEKVETEEIKEQQGSLSDIVTDVCMSAQESKEETTKDEESIESYDGRKEKLVIPSVNEGCEETGLKFVESIEEVQLFDSSIMKRNEQAIATFKDDEDKDQEVNMLAKGQRNDNVTSSQDAASEEDLQEKDCHNEDDESEFVKARQAIKKYIEEIGLNENEVANKDEDQEKEQELEMSKEVQGDGDDVISSENAQNKDIKETTTNRDATIMAYFNEQSLNGNPKEVLKEETKEKSIDAQEACERYENEGPEGSANKPVHSHSEIGEATIKEDETDAGNKEEVCFENSKFEAREVGDGTESETTGGTQKISPDNKDDTIADESKSTEAITQDVDMPYDKTGYPLAEETEDEKLNKKEDWCMDLETDEQKSIDASEQEKSISSEQQAQVEKELQEDLRGQQLEDSISENPYATEQDILEEVGEKATMKPEEITKQTFQESQTETNKEVEAKLDGENQADRKEEGGEMKDDVVLMEKMSTKLGQPMEQNVEAIQACQTTTMSEKTEDEIAEKDEDLSLRSIEDTNDNTTEEEKSVLDGRTREIEISTLEHEPVGEKTTLKPEEITKHAFQESQIETNKKIEAKLDVENQADRREDKSEMKDEVIVTEKMSSELGRPMQQNDEEIQTCRTTTMSEKIEEEIAKKDEALSLGSKEDTNDNTIKEEKSFHDGRTREIEISALEHEPIGEKTTIKPEEITKHAFQESQTETNKEVEAKLDAENQVDEREDRNEMKDETIVTEKMSSELGQPMQQNVEEIQTCRTTTKSEKIEEEIAKKDEDLSLGSIEDTNDNTAKEEKSFIDGRTREIEISTLEHEHVEEKNGSPDEVSEKKYIDLIEATTVELQEDFKPSRSPGTATKHTPYSENSKAESENLPIENLDSVPEVQIPREVPKSEDSNLKEECLISATTYVDEERGTVTKEISNDEIAYSDPIPVENLEATEVRVDAQTGQEDLQATKDINCESKASSSIQALKSDLEEGAEKSARINGEVKNDGVDEAPKQERIPTLEDAATLEPQVNLSNIESTYQSASDKSPTQALESVIDVQTPEVVADSDESKVKEELIVLATADHTDENSGEEAQEIKTNEISSAKTAESKQVVEHPSEKSPTQAVESVIDVQTPEVVADSDESKVKEERIVLETTEHADEYSVEEEQEIKTNEITSAETAESKQVVEHPSDKLPTQALESIIDVQTAGVVDDSEESKVKEECIVLETAEHIDENSVEEEREIKTNEISSAETAESKQVVEQPSDKSPTQALESVSDVQTPEVVVDSEESKVKEEHIVLETAEHTDENSVEEEQEIKTNEISSAETAESKQVVEHLSNKSPTQALESIIDVQTLEVVADTEESIVKEERIVLETTEHTDENSVEEEQEIKINEISSAKTAESKQVVEHPSEKSPTQVVESIIDVQTPEAVVDSDESKVKEERIVLETADHTDEYSVEEEQEIKTNEISSVETAKSKQVVEHPSDKSPTQALESIIDVQTPEVVADSEESKVKEERIVLETAEHTKEEQEIKINEISNAETAESKQVIEQLSDKLPTQALESVIDVQTPEVVVDSKESKVKEGCIVLDTAEHTDENSVEEEREIKTNEISSAETAESKQVVEQPSDKSPTQALESVTDVQTPEVVVDSEESKVKEKHIVLETAEHTDEYSVEEEQEIKINEISSAKTAESKQVVEHPSDKSPTQALESIIVQTPEVVADSEESRVKEERIVLETDENNGEEEQEIKANEISSTETTESKQVVEHASMMCPDAVLIEENLELYGELKPTSELTIDEDQVNETKPQPEQSDITFENIMKYQTLESKLEHSSEKDLNRSRDMEEDDTLASANQINNTEDQNETMKNVIFKENVVETEKEGRTEVKRPDSEEDNCPKELEKTSTSNQKELANEIEYSKPIPIGNTEVVEVKAECQRELENIPKDLNCLSKAPSTIRASKVETNEGIGQTDTVIGEVKDDSVDEASRCERVPNLEDAKALELQANFPKIESIDTPSNDQDDKKLREGMLWSTQETIEQKGVLSSQLTGREILEEEATENRKEEPNLEFEKEEKDDGLISERQAPKAILKMEMKEEHLEATNDSCETLTGGLSSEKLLDELKEIDDKEDTEIIIREETAAEDSYQDAAAEVTAIMQTKEKLVSMVPHEELTSPTVEDQTNELITETDNTKVEHRSISNKDQDPEEFIKTLSEDQRSAKEKCIEEEVQGNFDVENKEAESGNEAVEDVLVNEVLLEVENAKESKSIKDNINEEASCVPNQLTSATDEVCQIKRLNSSPNELLEAEGSVEGIGDPKLMAENLNLKAETSTIMKGPTEDMKQDVEKTSEIVSPEFERLENMVTEEKMIEADANKEKETLDEPQADDPAKTTSDSISSSTEQDKEVRSEESSGHGDMHKLEEEPAEVFELTSEVDEIVSEGKEVSTMLRENLPEASPEMILVKHDPETTTTIDKIEEVIKDKDETLVNMDFSTSTKEVACLSNEKTGELQVSTLNTEIDEGKQDGMGDMLNKEREAVQPHEHISDVDPPSDIEIKEQGELMHCGSQEPSEDNALPSQNDKKIADLLVLPSVQKETTQGVDKRFEEAPAVDHQKHENDLAYTAKARTVDVLSMAESPEIEQQHINTKEATLEPINQENQSEQKKEADENIQSDIPIEKVPKQTTAHKEIAEEFLVMPVAKEEEKSNYLQDDSKEEEHSGKKTYKDLEAVMEPSQTDKVSTEPQYSSEVVKEEKKISDEKEKSETPEPATILRTDIMHESTQKNSGVAENLIEERETAPTKDQQVDKEETGDNEAKTDEEDEAEDDEDNEKMGSCSDAPVMIEASKDMEVKVHKKSHNILSGVGSKVKHSIAKVKKAITGKSSHPKPPSPKEREIK